MSSAPTTRRARVAPARRVAFTVLRRAFEQGAYTDRAFHAEAGALDARDRALAMRLTFGAVQRRDTLDFLLGRLSDRPIEQLDPGVLAAARLGLYELVFLDGAPDRAVVADAVELAKTQRRRGHTLVNAVLRRAAAEARGILDTLDDRTPASAAVLHSHPLWVSELWWRHLGAAGARALMAADNEPAEQSLRANTLVTDAEALVEQLDVPARRDGELPEAVVTGAPFDAHGSPLWRAGAYMPQSRAAMLVSRALAPEPGQRVLDLCAAPGAKTTHIAALMDRRGEVVAVERHPGRAAALRRTCERMRAGCVRVVVQEAAEMRAEREFDRVLVDPPCSGLGTLQARPDARWRVGPQDLAGLRDEQAAILRAGAAALRPGGVLVYSTCTISPVENEDVVSEFLADHPQFRADDLGCELPHLVHPDHPRFALTLPHRDRTAGFFIARLVREELDAAPRIER